METKGNKVTFNYKVAADPGFIFKQSDEIHPEALSPWHQAVAKPSAASGSIDLDK